MTTKRKPAKAAHIGASNISRVQPAGNQALIAALYAIYDHQAERWAWLHSKQKLLGGKTPVSMMATPVGFAKVLSVAQQCADGVFV